MQQQATQRQARIECPSAVERTPAIAPFRGRQSPKGSERTEAEYEAATPAPFGCQLAVIVVSMLPSVALQTWFGRTVLGKDGFKCSRPPAERSVRRHAPGNGCRPNTALVAVAPFGKIIPALADDLASIHPCQRDDYRRQGHCHDQGAPQGQRGLPLASAQLNAGMSCCRQRLQQQQHVPDFGIVQQEATNLDGNSNQEE